MIVLGGFRCGRVVMGNLIRWGLGISESLWGILFGGA